MGPLSMGERTVPADNAVSTWGIGLNKSVFVLIEIRQLTILYKGVECILVVGKDVIRQDIDSARLPSSLCSTLFLVGFRQRKMEQKELGQWLLKNIDQRAHPT